MKQGSEDWLSSPLKRACFINRLVLSEKTEPEHEIKYLDIGNVDLNGVIFETETIPFENAPSRARRIAVHGDTIVSTVRTYLRAITGIFDPPENLIVSTGFAVLTPRKHIDPRFLSYSCRSEQFIHSVISNSTGVSYPAINPSELGNLEILFPPRLQQSAIADFLDKETARIDTLILKEERLLKLLDEKRTAFISHAVTKGLDPSAALKDSGIKWLGEIPAAWPRSRLSVVADFEQGKAHEPYIDEDGDYVCVNARFISSEGAKVKKSRANLTPARANDILMVMSDLPNGRALAKAYIVRENDKYAVNQRVCRLRPKNVEPDYLYYLLNRNPHFLSYNDGHNQTHLPNSAFTQMPIFLPSRIEQKTIADALTKEDERFKALKSKITLAIDLLREKRTALISAAVTGKIEITKGAA